MVEQKKVGDRLPQEKPVVVVMDERKFERLINKAKALEPLTVLEAIDFCRKTVGSSTKTPCRRIDQVYELNA